MNKNLFCMMVFGVSLAFGGTLFAQVGDVYFSLSDAGATPGDVNVTLKNNDTGSLFVYYQPRFAQNLSGINTGFHVQCPSSESGVIEYTGGELFNVQAVGGENRFAATSVVIADDFQNVEFNGVNLPPLTPNPGISVSGALDDENYFVDTNSFLMGRVDFEVVSDIEATTAVDLMSSCTGIVSSGMIIDVEFWTATISVTGAPGFDIGDVNQDGFVDPLDVAIFVELILSGQFQIEADINQDGSVDLLDVTPFVDLLLGN